MSDETGREPLATEEVLEPDLPIIDPHQHLWVYPDSVYLGGELLADIGGHNVVQTVAVEAWPRNVRDHGGLDEPWQETARAVAESARNPGRTLIAAGIVGYADLRESQDVERALEAHLRAAEGRFSGIRGAWDSDPSDERYWEGCAIIARHGLSIDVVAGGRRMLDLVPLAARFPDTPLIINHLGMPPRWLGEQGTWGGHDVEAWKEVITRIAGCDNLYMKLGGLGMDLVSAGWREAVEPDSVQLAELMRPWYVHCIEHFGAERCMLESNFPVDKRSFSCNVHWNAAKRLTAELSPTEREWLFRGAATRAYRL